MSNVTLPCCVDLAKLTHHQTNVRIWLQCSKFRPFFFQLWHMHRLPDRRKAEEARLSLSRSLQRRKKLGRSPCQCQWTCQKPCTSMFKLIYDFLSGTTVGNPARRCRHWVSERAPTGKRVPPVMSGMSQTRNRSESRARTRITTFKFGYHCTGMMAWGPWLSEPVSSLNMARGRAAASATRASVGHVVSWFADHGHEDITKSPAGKSWWSRRPGVSSWGGYVAVTPWQARYCDVKGWQYKTSAEFKRSELVILLRVLVEPSLSRRARRRRQLRFLWQWYYVNNSCQWLYAVPQCQCQHPPPAGHRRKAVQCQLDSVSTSSIN